MTDVSGKFFSAKKVRTGVSPSSPGVQVGETLPPVNPPGAGLNSVGLTMPTAFNVANSPLTSNGTLAVTGAGTVAQYVRGDGSLADFPSTTGGGSSVSYYLNGSVNQGTIGGIAYKELNRNPVLGTGTDFTISADGYIASFITDAGDPNKLLIPAGNWNFETYFSASSGGGSPTFYVELYKVSGSTATLIASSSSAPELIAFGTNLNPYFSTLAVPETILTLTDRLALRYYVNTSGRTITLHTENNHLCQVITTFTTGLTALNGLTTQVQFFAVGTSGTNFNISSATDTHTFNLPTASGTNRGALSSADWALFTQAYNDKINSASVTGTTTKTLTLTQQDGGTITASWTDLNTDAVISVFGRTGAVVAVSGDYTTAQVTESGNLYFTNARSRQAISLTTSGTSGAATYDNSTGVFNIPNYGGALSAYLPLVGGTMTGNINWAQTDRGLTWAFNTDGASIKFYNSSDGDTNSRLEFATLDNNNEYFRWVHIPDGGSTYESMRLVPISSGNAELIVTGKIIKSGGTSSQFLKADGSVDSTTYVPVGRTITINGTTQDLSANRTYNVGTVTSVTASSPLFSSGGTTPNITIQQASGSQSGFLSSTDWSTFNSKQNALTNPVTGTGTTNYLPKFTGSTTIGNSNLVDVNGYLVLGNSSSVYGQAGRGTFEINGSADNIFAMRVGGGLAGYLYTNSSAMELYSTTILQLSTAGSVRATLTSGGNLLVGTTTDAGFKLDVNGTGRFSGTLSTSAGNAISAGGTTFAVSPSSTRGVININGSSDQLLTFSSQSYIYNSNSLFRLLSSSDIDFVSGGLQRLLISASTGNVGIGTSTLTTNELIRELVVNQNINNGVSRLKLTTNFNSQDGEIVVSSYLGENLMAVGTNSNSPLILKTNSSPQMTITSGGDVLVKGQYNPYTATNRGNITLNGTNSNILGFANNTNTRGYILHDGTDIEIVNQSSGQIQFFVASGESFRVLSTGAILTYSALVVGGSLNAFTLQTLAPTGTQNEFWRLGRALLATSSDPEDRWIRVQLGNRIYDILAIDRGAA